jgi:outer membrane cobalamin receptor
VRILVILVLILVWASSGSVHPADAQVPTVDEQVVVTGAVAPTSLGAVGRTLTVLTRADLQDLPVRSVADALRLVPGLWVRARGPFGSQTDFSMRGAGFGQVLVLIDGVRLNDVQSGHHNGDFPINLDDIERIEVLAGAGSSLFGADAVGGTINIITRSTAAPASVRVAAGQHGLAQVLGGWRPAGAGPVRSVSGTFERSDGFAPVRDFRHEQVRIGLGFGSTAVNVSHLDKAFGAAGYYGPAPSREWTSQTLVAADGQHALGSTRRLHHTTWYRTHGDRFVYDSRPAVPAANRHRTHSTGATVRIHDQIRSGVRVSAGGELALDVIRSSALGDHEESRGSGFAELEVRAGRLLLYPGLRADGYSAFGQALSPSLAAAWTLAPRVKWRAAAGRAFRVPTFTERFYTDPNHRATPGLSAERGWTSETGLDWYPAGVWMASVTAFGRQERDVIDWVRETRAERWQTANIREVSTRGVEASLRGRTGPVAVGAQYAWTAVETDRVSGLSKYVLDYARHGLGADMVLPLRGQASLSGRAEYRRPVARPAYALVDVRLQKGWRRLVLFAEASNLLAADYQEIAGVAMPGRWLSTGIEVRP